MRHFSLKQHLTASGSPKWVKCVDADVLMDDEIHTCLMRSWGKQHACVRRTQMSLTREQVDSALWTHWCTAVQREREGMGLWKHAALPPPPPPHPHEFSYSSDAVQERSARTSTALTYKPTLQDWRIRRQHRDNYTALHSICEVSMINIYIFNVLTFIINPLLEFPHGEIEHLHMRSCVRARDCSHCPARAAIMRHSHWWRAPVSSY